MRFARLPAVLVLLSGLVLPAAEPRYEMARYVIGFLKKGPKWTADAGPEGAELQKRHIAHLEKMGRENKLIVAGPVRPSPDDDLRGILIFDVEDPETVREIVNQDPTIQAGRLRVELFPWFAAKGLKINPPVAPAP